MKMPISKNQVPTLATALVLVLLFSTASALYEHFCSFRVVLNLFRNNAHLGVIAVGMTFVILSGGIDLSVGSILGFTTIFIATLTVQSQIHPVLVWGIALGLGTLLGAGMGCLIQFYALPAFLVTLGGMFFARGMAFMVNPLNLSMNNVALYGRIQKFGIDLGQGLFVSTPVLIFLGIFLIGLYIAHFTRFGRNVYAIGGNEQSALLMGLPVASTKVGVYAFSGFCSALAGIVSTAAMASGDPARGVGMELNAIAAVVIGGTLLTGGVGYLVGTLLGILIFGTIGTIITFDGRLDSSWQNIAVGGLLFLFVALQKYLSRANIAAPDDAVPVQKAIPTS